MYTLPLLAKEVDFEDFQDRMTAAGTYVSLKPGAADWSQPADLPAEYHHFLVQILAKVKNRLCPGTDPTKNEINYFINWIFDNWSPGVYINHRLSGNIKPIMHDVSIMIGRLRSDAPCRSAQAGIKSHQCHRHSPNGNPDPFRWKGQPVYLMPEWTPSSGYHFTFRDKRGNLFDNGTPVRMKGFRDLNEAMLFAMRKYDDFLVSVLVLALT